MVAQQASARHRLAGPKAAVGRPSIERLRLPRVLAAIRRPGVPAVAPFAPRAEHASGERGSNPLGIDPMNMMTPPRSVERRARRVRLTMGPTAAAEARRQVQASIRAWNVPVDSDTALLDTALLLTSELVTNAIKHTTGGPVTLTIHLGDRLCVEVHDSSPLFPTLVDAPADAEAGRGLMLVTSLAAEWGFYRTPRGKAVYFALTFCSELGQSDGRRRAQPKGNGHVSQRTGRAS